MSILPTTPGSEPVGAVALLDAASPRLRSRFQALEDAVWSRTTLPSAVIEAVRLRSAHLRGCEFCSAVRVSAGREDGLGEAEIARLDDLTARAALPPVHRAALTLVDHALGSPTAPAAGETRRIGAALGSRGVVEVLAACAAFASADLRIALGENRAPDGDGVVLRARAPVPRPAAAGWPALTGRVLDPAQRLPGIDEAVAGPIADQVAELWDGSVVPPELMAACAVRSAQLLGIDAEEPVADLLLPPSPLAPPDRDHVRGWPAWTDTVARDVLALAEQLWVDPAGVGPSLTAPLRRELGTAGVIALTWSLIWVGQLHRLALVLHRGR
jgi:alkylhydroperoxidase family enzyme